MPFHFSFSFKGRERRVCLGKSAKEKGDKGSSKNTIYNVGLLVHDSDD